VIRLGRCFCPNCGKENYGTGRFGTSLQCSCGAWIPQTTLDRVRHYWIVQIALVFGVAAFFFALALFFRDLPNDPWERFLSPILQGPAVAVFMVSYLILIRYKKRYDGDNLMFRYFLWGVCLMSTGIVAALLVAMSDKLEGLIR
jgi:vacuolar-type H+-ATPase subunit I/STV1